MAQFLFKRSGTANKRPDPAQMALGEVDLNYDATSGGLFYKNSGGSVIKVGPAQVSATAPNATPAGSSGNALGEFWYDTGASALCIWDGSAWQATGGGGSGIPCSLLTAKGDMIVASGANTPAALPVGFNGQVLVACSTCTNGVGWASIPAATPAVSGVVRGLTTDGLTLNTALGLGSLNTSLTGERNTAVGSATLGSLTTGSRNASFGQASLAAVATGNDNTGLGYASLSNATGSDNTAVGSAAAQGVTGGTCNTALGSCSLASATSGSSNIAIGYKAGCLITTGSQNIVIGPLAQVPNVTNSCQLAIGFSATDYWLTGDCTKAIKPGAGILDCADATGFAGQALFSNGSNAVCWGYLPASISPDLLCCQNAAGCGQLGGNLIVGGYGDGSISPAPLYPGCGGQILTIDPVNGANPLKWCTANYLCGACFAKGSIPVGCAQVGGGIQTVSIVNQNNPGKPPGYYADVPVGGGSGTGATVNVNIINVGYFPAVDSVEVASPGTGYLNGETGLTMTIDGTTLTTTLTVSSLNTNTVFNYSYLPVGTNGQVLTADSACTNGVKWAAAGGGSSATPTVSGTLLGCSTASRTAVGCNALLNNTAVDITAVGICALCANTTGNGNTAVGAYSMQANTNGTYNTAVGISALRDTNGGLRNAAVGENALRANTTGCFNVAVGSNALRSNTSSNDNTAVGFCSLFANAGTLNTAVGSLALNSNTSGGSNTAVGVNALRGNLISSGSTAVGLNALCASTAGGNSAFGCGALRANTTGTENVAVGCGALLANVCGARNTAIGNGSLSNTTGCDNVAIGSDAILNNLGGSGSVAIGSGALGTTNGSCNIAIGFTAGCNLTNGTNNVILGSGVNPTNLSGSCQLAIGWAAGSCWLTGCSTGAIRPGAGIMDCTGATGTAGQVLMSNGANALCWGTASGGISQTIIDAKGDLIVGCAADCAIRLASGTNGQVLAVNTACPTGLQWVNGSGIASGIFTAKGQLIASCAAGVACALSPGGDGELLAVCSACPTGFTWAAPGGVALAQPSVAGAVYGNFYLYCEGYPPYYCSMSFGYGSLGNTSGLDSNGTLAVGHDVLNQAICTFGNTAVGISTMFFGHSNQNNVAVGNSAMYGTCCATNNVAIGYATLLSAGGSFLGDSNACGNVAVGAFALCGVTTGSQNTGIGDGVGIALTTGDNNILIGAGTGNSAPDGLACITTESNRILVGNSLHSCAQIQVAWTTVSDVRDKALDPAGVPYGLLFVEQLEPIAYRWCNRETNEVTDERLRYGFSAQNVRSLEGDNAVIVSDDNPEKLMITDQHLLPVLVNAIKELSEKNKLLEERIATLESKA